MRDCLMDGVWVPTCHLKKSIPSRAEKCVCVCVCVDQRERGRERVFVTGVAAAAPDSRHALPAKPRKSQSRAGPSCSSTTSPGFL